MPHVIVANDLTAHPGRPTRAQQHVAGNRGPATSAAVLLQRMTVATRVSDPWASFKRGARASYYRKPQDDSRDKEKAISSSAAHMIDTPQRRIST